MHGALAHLDEAADAVLGVHDVVAGLERDEVDGVAAPGGELAGLGRGRAVAGEVGLGEHDEHARREPLHDPPAGDGDQALLRLVDKVVDERGGHFGVAELLHRALRRAVAAEDEHGGAAGGDVRAEVDQRAVDVAAVGRHLVGARDERVVAAGEQRAERDDRVAGGRGVLQDVGEVAVGRGADVDRGAAAHARGEPARFQELLPGADEVGAAGAHPLRVGDEHQRAVGQQVGEQLQLGPDQRGDERLHALARDALGQVLQQLAQRRVVLVGAGQRGGAFADGVGEQQLAAAGCVEHVDGVGGALVGDRERAQLADLVAPELDAHGVLGGRREHVDDAAAHRELAARGDHLDARVGQLDEAHEQGVEVVGVADAQVDGVERAQAGGDGLDEAARGRDEHARGRVRGQAAEQGEPAPHRVRAGREALVREGLPAGEHRNGARVDQIRGGGAQVLGLAVGGGDGEHGAVFGERGGEERAQRRRALDAQGGGLGGVQVGVADGVQVGLGEGGAEQAGKLGHDRDFPLGWARGQTPAWDAQAGPTSRLRRCSDRPERRTAVGPANPRRCPCPSPHRPGPRRP